jgi:hypothetical protein
MATPQQKSNREHSFDAELASLVGIEKAILLKNIDYWVGENERRKIDSSFAYGKWWTFESLTSLAKKYPYMKRGNLSRWFKELKESKWIIMYSTTDGANMYRPGPVFTSWDLGQDWKLVFQNETGRTWGGVFQNEPKAVFQNEPKGAAHFETDNNVEKHIEKNVEREGEREAEKTPSLPKDFDEMIQRVNAEVATIEAEKEKISPVPAAPSFPGSDISEEADELKNGVVRRDGPNYEAKKEKVSCHHSCGPGDFWEGGKCARMGCYTKESPTHVVTAVDGQTLPGALVTTVEGLSLEQTTRETAAEALTRRISNPLADNAIDAGKLIEVWCAENSETVKWAYDAARRKLTPDDLSARIIDFCGCYANSVEPGKQVLFFGDPARMFKNGLTKWLQTQNKFDREQAAKPNTGKFQQQDNAAAYVAPKAVRPVQTFYE